jgi:hypothetical protein
MVRQPFVDKTKDYDSVTSEVIYSIAIELVCPETSYANLIVFKWNLYSKSAVCIDFSHTFCIQNVLEQGDA